jgi:hypothetical protein
MCTECLICFHTTYLTLLWVLAITQKGIILNVKVQYKLEECLLFNLSFLSMVQIYMNAQTVLVLGNAPTDGTAERSSIISVLILGMHQQVGFAHECAGAYRAL